MNIRSVLLFVNIVNASFQSFPSRARTVQNLLGRVVLFQAKRHSSDKGIARHSCTAFHGGRHEKQRARPHPPFFLPPLRHPDAGSSRAAAARRKLGRSARNYKMDASIVAGSHFDRGSPSHRSFVRTRSNRVDKIGALLEVPTFLRSIGESSFSH